MGDIVMVILMVYLGLKVLGWLLSSLLMFFDWLIKPIPKNVRDFVSNMLRIAIIVIIAYNLLIAVW